MMSLLFAAQTVLFTPQPDIALEIKGTLSQKSPWVFFAPHENENVVNDYVTEQVREKGGAYVVLKQNNQRGIALKFGEDVVVVDPNRIFTQRGIQASIRKSNLNKKISEDLFEKATERAYMLGQFIVENLGGKNTSMTWIATHNNTQGYTGDGNTGYGTISINRYQKKLSEAAAYLADVHNAGKDEDDLFFVTEQPHFDAMKQAGYNTVLQHPQVAWLEDEDDGSLSVYAEMLGINYINIEAERHDAFLKTGENHLDEQIDMVNFTIQMLLNSKEYATK
ncbi:hypothetical protein DRW07_17590 [Alteromonas sediminis]|uniref:Uncharacterized protein n=1 Tax=Alteromonas sediminis TaxID=2259342 RepID=A0A3N5XWP1_9ALTE|nr:hypothetical protein [Alteromonas sediminis]RPJ65122.1 hypothetical protein DRW07_17590 [Alteromonas sediminis]